MFNKSTNPLKTYHSILVLLIVITSCSRESKLVFDEVNIEQTKNTEINISYPKAEGTAGVSKTINKHIETFIVSELNMTETDNDALTVQQVVQQFDEEYRKFKAEFGETSQAWTATVNGKVIYETESIICISLESYLDTGGAHGNGNITFLNFNPKTGALLNLNDIINNKAGFKQLAQKYFEKETKETEQIEDYFFGKDFQLPANLGFSNEGIILLYNNYEIASYAQGITEFVIPFEEAKAFLKVN